MGTSFRRAAVISAVLCWTAPASAAGTPVEDPSVAVKEIMTALADARAEDATAAVAKYLCTSPSSKFNFDSMVAAFKIITQQGKADTVDEISNNRYGTSVEDIVEYLHFPALDVPVNQFVFMRYIFMRTSEGWLMSSITYATAGVFPPPNWTKF